MINLLVLCTWEAVGNNSLQEGVGGTADPECNDQLTAQTCMHDD